MVAEVQLRDLMCHGVKQLIQLAFPENRDAQQLWNCVEAVLNAQMPADDRDVHRDRNCQTNQALEDCGLDCILPDHGIIRGRGLMRGRRGFKSETPKNPVLRLNIRGLRYVNPIYLGHQCPYIYVRHKPISTLELVDCCHLTQTRSHLEKVAFPASKTGSPPTSDAILCRTICRLLKFK